MQKYSDLKRELLKDPEVRKEYDRLGPRYQAIAKLIEARIEKGLTQKQLAAKLKTKQSAIARFETGNINPSLAFLERLAQVFDKKLVISFK